MMVRQPDGARQSRIARFRTFCKSRGLARKRVFHVLEHLLEASWARRQNTVALGEVSEAVTVEAAERARSRPRMPVKHCMRHHLPIVLATAIRAREDAENEDLGARQGQLHDCLIARAGVCFMAVQRGIAKSLRASCTPSAQNNSSSLAHRFQEVTFCTRTRRPS